MPRWRLALAGLLIFGSCVQCGCGEEDVAPRPAMQLAVLAAFPAELTALLERAEVGETLTIDGHIFRRGTLGGVPVVLAMTGIGLVNAQNTTRLLLNNFRVDGVVISGVANSTHRIGDVTVPASWALKGGATFAAHKRWLDIATNLAAAGQVELGRCGTRADVTPPQQFCIAGEPQILVGGLGESSDSFRGMAFACQPNGGDLYGCDVDSSVPALRPSSHQARRDAIATDQPSTIDMETAAIALEVTQRGLPFIAFRAASDGEGDPLNLPGPFFQFAAYYRFAAQNAAAATSTFLQRLAPP